MPARPPAMSRVDSMQPFQAVLGQLQSRLGYSFQDPALLRMALTHRSFIHEGDNAVEDNERLEFLGDSVLSTVIATHIYHQYPDYPEGELTRLRAVVVSQPVLADCVRAIDLGRYIRFGAGEELSGGALRASNLASGFEAILGAVYLDGGLAAATHVILKHLGDKIDRLSQDAIKLDYKTALQKQVQACGFGLPAYRTRHQYGPQHAHLFEVIVQINGTTEGHGLGRSKREAQQRAARMALRKLKTHEEFED